jgi:large subunit ribosomal protein L35
MKKLKTKKAAAKRFKITGTGKVMHLKSGKRHLLGKKSAKGKRNNRGDFQVAATERFAIKEMLPGI